MSWVGTKSQTVSLIFPAFPTHYSNVTMISSAISTEITTRSALSEFTARILVHPTVAEYAD